MSHNHTMDWNVIYVDSDRQQHMSLIQLKESDQSSFININCTEYYANVIRIWHIKRPNKTINSFAAKVM